MPFFKYKCGDCGSEGEAFERTKYNPETKETYMDSAKYCGQEELWCDFESGEQIVGCGSTNIHRQLPRSFGIQGESTGSGCDARGYFSASLGRYVKSRMEERKIMDKSGFVPLSDLGGDKWFEDATNERKTKIQQQSNLENKYQSLVDSGVSKEDAVMETWSAKDAVDGTLDKVYDDSIKH